MKSKRWMALILMTFFAAAFMARSHAQSVARKAVRSASRQTAQDGETNLILAGTIVQAIGIQGTGRNWNLAVPLNTWVNRGDVIGTDDSRTLQAQMDGARQEFRDARWAERRAKDRVRQVEEQLGKTQAQVREMTGQEAHAEIAKLDTEREFERRDTLFRSGIASWFDYNTASNARDAADAAIDSTYSSLAVARFESDDLESKAQDAQAELREATRRRTAAEAVLDQMNAEAGDGLIVAPADGIIVSSAQPEGAGIGIAADPRQLCAYAMLPQADLMSVRIGQQWLIVLDSRPETTLHATVSAISATPVDSEGVFYQVTFAVDNPGGAWLAGAAMHARQTPSIVR